MKFTKFNTFIFDLAFEVFLDESFSFLLSPNDEIESIFKSKKLFIAFLAGFIDADGSICISNNKAVFQIGNYNKRLLNKIRKKLLEFRIKVPKLYVDKKLRINTYGYRRKKYYWSLRIQRKISLLKLFNLIKPYLRHGKRTNDLERALENIKSRGD